MENYLVDAIYNNERYKVPYKEMGRWLAYMKDLSLFVLYAGHLQIAFHDAFNKYKISNGK